MLLHSEPCELWVGDNIHSILNDRQFLSVDLAKSMCIYIYIYGHVYVYVCVCACGCVCVCFLSEWSDPDCSMNAPKCGLLATSKHGDWCSNHSETHTQQEEKRHGSSLWQCHVLQYLVGGFEVTFEILVGGVIAWLTWMQRRTGPPGSFDLPDLARRSKRTWWKTSGRSWCNWMKLGSAWGIFKGLEPWAYFCWAQSAVDEGSIDLSGTATGIFADVTVMS